MVIKIVQVNSLQQSPSWEAVFNSISQETPQNIMEHESSFMCSKQPATEPLNENWNGSAIVHKMFQYQI
jgi:hypothetical protein